jgi:hypothetical protein
MIDAPHGFTLTTTDAPKGESRPRPLLTVERGPRDAGRAGVLLEPTAERFGIFNGQTPDGEPVLYLYPVMPDGTPDTRPGARRVAQVTVGECSRGVAITFLADLRDAMTEANGQW